jgi:hypothetical protein
LVDAGLANFILARSAFMVIPVLRLAKTGDILGEYLEDLGVRSLV